MASHPLRIPVPADGGYLVPDALFGLEYRSEHRKTYRFFALEADRATMPLRRSAIRQSSYGKKVGAYRKIVAQGIHRSHLGLPNLLVLTVTTSEVRCTNMLSIMKDCADSTMFLFKVWSGADGRPSAGLLLDTWVRAGHSALSIGTP